MECSVLCCYFRLMLRTYIKVHSQELLWYRLPIRSECISYALHFPLSLRANSDQFMVDLDVERRKKCTHTNQTAQQQENKRMDHISARSFDFDHTIIFIFFFLLLRHRRGVHLNLKVVVENRTKFTYNILTNCTVHTLHTASTTTTTATYENLKVDSTQNVIQLCLAELWLYRLRAHNDRCV